MSLGTNTFQEKYKDSTTEELEEEYNKIKKHIGLVNKEDRTKFIADNYLNRCVSNYYTKMKVLEELLKKKTGKDYSINLTEYDKKIKLNDIINYISKGDNSKICILNNIINSFNNDAIGELIEDMILIYDEEVINEIEKRNDIQIEKEKIIEVLKEKTAETTIRKILGEKLKDFLLLLYNDKKSYKKFFDELSKTNDYPSLILKYYSKLYDYRFMHTIIG